MINKVLVVDDEPLILNFLKEILVRLKKSVTICPDGKAAIERIEKENFDLIITDMKMPQKNGLEVLKKAKKINPNCLVIIISAYGTVEDAVEAMNLGAFNYLLKPFSYDSIETIIRKAEEHLALLFENNFLRLKIFSYEKNDKIIAESSFMKNLIKNIDNIAKSSSSIFISGESGSGKEVIAKLLHEKSNRKNCSFIKVNCAAIAETLLESEFFGHEKGSFTSAIEKKKGRFELANRGSLLLDEITEIPINLQAKLLRAIQEQEFERVGGVTPIKVDIRFISTSNQNIKKLIKDKQFREDLFYRLNVIPIHIIPLRERRDDIIPLAEFFLKKFCIENHKIQKKITKKAKEKLFSYPWPGNVRELANIIERAVVMDLSKTIDKEHIILDMLETSQKREMYLGKPLSEVEKILIFKTLESENYNKTRAAKILGITTNTLNNKLHIYKKIF